MQESILEIDKGVIKMGQDLVVWPQWKNQTEAELEGKVKKQVQKVVYMWIYLAI